MGLFFLVLGGAGIRVLDLDAGGCIKNERLDSTEKIVWVLVIVFLHALGALIYYLVGRDRAARDQVLK